MGSRSPFGADFLAVDTPKGGPALRPEGTIPAQTAAACHVVRPPARDPVRGHQVHMLGGWHHVSRRCCAYAARPPRLRGGGLGLCLVMVKGRAAYGGAARRRPAV